MKNRLKHLLCLSITCMMLLAIVGCKGAVKKDQVVHVGETVQYGDFEFTFLQHEIGHKTIVSEEKIIVCINIDCRYNGESNTDIYSSLDFHIYADGSEIKYNNLIDMYAASCFENFNIDKQHITVASGRPSDLWVAVGVPLDTKKVEFDFTHHLVSSEWGRITYVVDIP